MTEPKPAQLTREELDHVCLGNLLAYDSETYFKDADSRFIRLGRGQVERFNASSEDQIIGKSDFDFFDRRFAEVSLAMEQQIMASGQPLVDFLQRVTWPSGQPMYVRTTKRPLRGPDGTIIGTFGINRDVTEPERVRQQLETVLEMSPDAICRLDSELRYVYVNPAAAAMIGQATEDIVSDTAVSQRAAQLLDWWKPALRMVLETAEPADVEHAEGEGETARYFESRIVAEKAHSSVTGVLVMTRDITDRKNAELALAERALRDPLTGLANRVLLHDRIEQSLVRLDRYPGIVALLFLDLNGFKPINDTLGHAHGDALLVAVADRLTAAARRSDTVGRFGGDEFVILCDRVASAEDARVIAERIIRDLAAPFVLGGHETSVTASIGIVTTSDARSESATLVRDADTAMYQAKERRSATGNYQFFDSTLRDRAAERLTIESELRRALEQDELRLHYQPLQGLSTGVVHGVEALVRWEHPHRGLLLPDQFLAVAEESTLIVEVGRWVLDEACRQLAEWNEPRAQSQWLRMAVNLSARQVSSPDLVTDVERALSRHDVSPALLSLEVSEVTLLAEASGLADVFERLHRIGVQIAVDGFGAGYSSLAHLRQFPINILKIDRAFVSALAPGSGNSAIVGAITAMARALGMTTVGEGVETSTQLAELRQLGCDNGQGFHVCRPMPASDLAKLLTG